VPKLEALDFMRLEPYLSNSCYFIENISIPKDHEDGSLLEPL